MSIEFATALRCIIAALFLVAACGPGHPDFTEDPSPDRADPSSGPCAGETPPVLCGTSCTADDVCGPGLYCGSGGVCTAECTLTGGQCGAGRVCSSKGYCIDAPADPGRPGDDCPRVDVALSAVTPTVLFLIDRSGSMGEQRFGNKSRWNAVADALIADPGGVVTQLASRVIFGATTYHNDVRGTCPDMVEVRPAIDNRAAIASLMTSNRPGGATPTGDAFRALLAALAGDPPPPESPAIIILATDGEPDTCAVPIPRTPAQREAARAEAVTGVKAAFDQGYRTYVLSVGSDIATAHLQDLANAGVGLPSNSPTKAPFFVANDQAQLVAALEQIIDDQRSCEVAVDGGSVDINRAGEGEVLLNGAGLAFGTEWVVSADGKQIILVDDACQTFLRTPSVELQASFPCGVIVE
jgi:hypothetical protein